MTVRQALSTHGETRRLLALAWPVVLTSLNWTLLQVTDVMVVGLVATEEVAALAAGLGLSASAMPSVAAAMAALTDAAHAPARILICGSLYLAGHVLEEN